jgi:hypothetical protein
MNATDERKTRLMEVLARTETEQKRDGFGWLDFHGHLSTNGLNQTAVSDRSGLSPHLTAKLLKELEREGKAKHYHGVGIQVMWKIKEAPQ